MLAAAAHDDLFLKQFDARTAFLRSALEEEVYMKQPYGFKRCKPGEVLLLLKALYDTCQAGQCFFRWLQDILLEDGWVQAECDPSKFMSIDSMGVCLAVIYVDDGIIAGPCKLVESVR